MKMGYYNAEDDLTDTTEEAPVPVYKQVLCGDNILGNIFYPLWRNVDCSCCALWRGIVTGSAITTVIAIGMSLVF